MPLQTAYPLVNATPLAGVLPPAYGTSTFAGALSTAYGNTELVILNKFGKYEGITYTQSGNLTYFDSTGTLQTAAVDTMVLDYDPSTLVLRGYPFWEARTNVERNNTMVGAVPGTPGTNPNLWRTPSLAGITVQIVAVSTVNGLNYIDYRFSGTGAGSIFIGGASANAAAASPGQSWTTSSWVAITAGGVTNITNIFMVNNFDVTGNMAVDLKSSVNSTLTRYTVTGTVPATNTGISEPFFNIVANGAIDITLRIAMPQTELGAFATPVIKTTTAAVTRAAPSCAITGTSFSSWYNQSQGTFVSADRGTAVSGNIIDVSDGTINNRLGVFHNATTSIDTFAQVGGVGQVSGSVAITAASQNKISFAYLLNDYAWSVNGAAAITDNSATVPSVNKANIGSNLFLGGYLNGWIYSLSYYSARLPNASLVSLST